MNSVTRLDAERKSVTDAQPDPKRALAVIPDKKPKPEPEADFDWMNDESIILREQPATAVYFNKENSLVIRQRGWPDEDAFIYITESNLDNFLDKLTDACGIPSAGKSR